MLKVLGSASNAGLAWTWHIVRDVSETRSLIERDGKTRASQTTSSSIFAHYHDVEADEVDDLYDDSHRDSRQEDTGVSWDAISADLDCSGGPNVWLEEDEGGIRFSSVQERVGQASVRNAETEELSKNPWQSAHRCNSNSSVKRPFFPDDAAVARHLGWDSSETEFDRHPSKLGKRHPANIVWHQNFDGSVTAFTIPPVKFDIAGHRDCVRTPSIESGDDALWSTCSSPCPKITHPNPGMLKYLESLQTRKGVSRAHDIQTKTRRQAAAMVTPTGQHRRMVHSKSAETGEEASG